MSSNLKLMIIGQGRHGKDTVCEILRDDLGYTFESSSMFASKKVVYPLLKKKYGYESEEECYEDRHNHRGDWYNIIHQYNNPKLYKLAEELYKENDIYCGLRHIEEFVSIKDKNLFDYCIWIDAEERLGKTEDSSSLTLSREDADLVVYNNDSLEKLKNDIIAIIKILEGNYNNNVRNIKTEIR